MRKDKKVKGGSIRFVLPTGIGSPPVMRAVPEPLISRALEAEGYG
jgi:3-dehydroquinate synthetase